MEWFRRLTLSTQFVVAGFPILLAGMVAIGFAVEREIERGVVAEVGEREPRDEERMAHLWTAGALAGSSFVFVVRPLCLCV